MSEEEKTGTEATTSDTAEQWWEAEGLPWHHKPSKEELWCWGLLMFYSLWSLVMMPLRAWLLTVPVVSVILNGSRSATTMVGALTKTGNLSREVGFATLAVGIISAVKWDLLYWWAGKLWGDAFLSSVAGKKGKAKKISDKLEKLAIKAPFLSLLVTYLPIPFTVVVYVVMGMAQIPWKKFFLLNLLCSALFNTGYFLLGWWVGQPAVDFLKIYGNYAMKVTLVLMVVTFVVAYRKQKA